MAVLNNEITSIEGQELKQQVQTIYEHIRYMHEAINLWASSQGRQGNEAMTGIGAAVADIRARMPSDATVSANGSKTFSVGKNGGMLLLYRSDASATPTVALIDRWGDITYISSNTNMTVTVSDRNATVSNGYGMYIQCTYIPFSA